MMVMTTLMMMVVGATSCRADLARTYTQDGVCLTESGLCQLQSLSAAASRRRKPKPKLKLKIINQNSVAVLQTPVDPLSELSRDEDMEDTRGRETLPAEGYKNKRGHGFVGWKGWSCEDILNGPPRICKTLFFLFLIRTRLYCIFLGGFSDLMAKLNSPKSLLAKRSH